MYGCGQHGGAVIGIHTILQDDPAADDWFESTGMGGVMCIFLPQSTDRHTEITANSKLLMGVNVRVDGCLSLYFRPFAAAVRSSSAPMTLNWIRK